MSPLDVDRIFGSDSLPTRLKLRCTQKSVELTGEGGDFYLAKNGDQNLVIDIRSPCVVAFFGGRDLSAILCVATHVARREGLSDPVPETHDFAGCGPSDESTGRRWLFVIYG